MDLNDLDVGETRKGKYADVTRTDNGFIATKNSNSKWEGQTEKFNNDGKPLLEIQDSGTMYDSIAGEQPSTSEYVAFVLSTIVAITIVVLVL